MEDFAYVVRFYIRDEDNRITYVVRFCLVKQRNLYKSLLKKKGF